MWHYSVNYSLPVNNRVNFRISENFRSSLLRTGAQNDKWKDDQNLGMFLNYSLSPALTLTSDISSIVFLDKQSGFNNDVRTHTGHIGLRFQPYSNFYADVSAGPKWDNRYNQHDQGVSYSVDVSGADLPLAEYNNNISLTLDDDRFNRRNNRDLGVAYRVNRQFTPHAADSLQVFFSNERHDNYVSRTGDIESQREETRGGRNTMFYRLGEQTFMRLNSFLELKDVELRHFGETTEKRRRKRNDQRFNNDLAFHVRKPHFRGIFNISHHMQEQRYDLEIDDADTPFSRRTAFITPDNNSSRFSVSSRIGTRVTRSDSLDSYFSVSRFQYDTPDEKNYDDRDELRINSRVTVMHHFSDMLRLDVLASVNLYHMVYIFGERSADNNWNRIFRLQPSISYKPAQSLSIHQSFEVLANYVDYDFETDVTTTRSFVFRKFAMSDSLKWNILPRTTLCIDYRLQLEENGQLSWEQWTERIMVTRQKQWLHLYWKYSTFNRLSASPGYSLYIRNEWRHKTGAPGKVLKEKSSKYKSHGPVFRIIYTPSANLRFFIDAVRYKVSYAGEDTYYINNVELGLNWIF